MVENIASEARQNPPLMVAFGIIALYILIAIFAPVLAPNDPNDQNLRQTLHSPSREFYLGTDEYGRDLLSRLIFATRSSTIVAVTVVVLSGVVGTALGIFTG